MGAICGSQHRGGDRHFLQLVIEILCGRPMTVLRDFIDEIASELDASTDKPLAPHHWISFVKLLDAIDRDDEMSELRQKMESIVTQHDVRFQDRCLALIPLLSADPAIAAAFTRRRHAAITAVAAL